MDQKTSPLVTVAAQNGYNIGREIRRNPSSETLRGEMLQLYRSAESTFRVIHQEGETHFGHPKACKAGCSHCCYQPVIAAPIEVVHMADYAERTLSTDQLEQLIERLAIYNTRRQEDRASSEMAACPMLVNEVCSLYEARPITCRAHHSYELSECIRLRNDPSYESTAASTDAMVIEVGAAIRGGLGKSLGKVSVFIGEALYLLFTDPAWREKWRNYSLDFGPAVSGQRSTRVED